MGLALRNSVHDVKTLAVLAGWAVLFLATTLVYWPGLHGPFVLDDFGSIAALGKYGGVRDWYTFKEFVFGGGGGPTGRPLSLVTFLIDGNNWPTDPYYFKRTNLIIHLLNGALLGILIARILHLLQFDKRRAHWIALVSAGCWMLHPFLVSTTLYAVQRMAQLSTLFIFCGLIAYLYGRSLLSIDRKKSYLLMTASITLFTFLAMIAKENGILLPVLVGVIEITVIASQQHRLPVLNRYWVATFVITPVLVIGVYLLAHFFKSDFFDVVPPRDFSLYERFLTQSRILVDYLQHWFIPTLYTTGVFQDHFIKSTGLLAPIATILTAIFHVIVIAATIINRRRWPLLSLAILFFYGGHLLESTVLNLELYFEHRNYLAASLLFLPLIAVLQKKTSHQVFAVAAIGMMLILGGFTRYSATIWASFPGIVEASAHKAPTSARAQAQYANNLFNANRREEALQVLDAAIEAIPNDNALLLVNRLIILCETTALDQDEYQRISKMLARLQYDTRLMKAYSTLIERVAEHRCPDVSVKSLRPMFHNMLETPTTSDATTLEFTHVQFLSGLVHLYSGEPALAVTAFNASLESRPGASYAMAMAAMLATSNYSGEALSMSDKALQQLHTEKGSKLIGATVSESDILKFQANIRAEINARQDADTADPAP